MKYKFEIKDLLPVGMTLVVVGLVLAFGLQILGDVRDDIELDESASCTVNGSGCTAHYNATGDAIDGVAKLPEKLPLIATVLVAVIIIGILVRFFTVR